MITNDLLYHLYHLALTYGGELHASNEEVALCFVLNSNLPSPESPKRQEDEPWPVEPSPAPTKPGRRVVLNDMNQFLKEQEMNHLNQSLYEDGRKQQRFRTGEMPFRNYPEGRPPNR